MDNCPKCGNSLFSKDRFSPLKVGDETILVCPACIMQEHDKIYEKKGENTKELRYIKQDRAKGLQYGKQDEEKIKKTIQESNRALEISVSRFNKIQKLDLPELQLLDMILEENKTNSQAILGIKSDVHTIKTIMLIFFILFLISSIITMISVLGH